MWDHFTCESFMEESNRVVREKIELEIGDRSDLKSFFENLDFQWFYTRNKMVEFLNKYSSTRVKFLIELLMEEIKPGVTENTESQYRKKIYTSLGCFGHSGVWNYSQKGFFLKGNFLHKCGLFEMFCFHWMEKIAWFLRKIVAMSRKIKTVGIFSSFFRISGIRCKLQVR